MVLFFFKVNPDTFGHAIDSVARQKQPKWPLLELSTGFPCPQSQLALLDGLLHSLPPLVVFVCLFVLLAGLGSPS